MISPEVSPFIKEGGLADVVGALPKALAALGHDVRVVCPRHGGLSVESSWNRRDGILFVPSGFETHYAAVWETFLDDRGQVPLYFIEYEQFFARGEVYHGPWGAHEDNGERFAFFARASLEICSFLGWIPDVVHCHDWTTCLVPVYLNTLYRGIPLARTASVLTIHSLEHQGHFPYSVFPYTGLPESVFREDGLESYGGMNWMKGGLYHATKITTVSPTYAEEIRSPEGGFGLDSVLRFKGGDLIGVLNGIDTEVWNPEVDPFLKDHYFSFEDLTGKRRLKALLQRRLGLELRDDIPLFGVVSRLFHQKGLDLLASVVERMVDQGRMQLAILGSGEAWEERCFQEAASRHPGLISATIGFDEALAHEIIAGSDFFIMPSRFEPCGLGQQYAMRYGTIPVVRRTGGLADTVVPYRTDGATGFLFDDPHPRPLLEKILEATTLWKHAPEEIKTLQENGMKRDASWASSAKDYENVYQWAVEAKK